jgi:hypothetical protein
MFGIDCGSLFEGPPIPSDGRLFPMEGTFGWDGRLVGRDPKLGAGRLMLGDTLGMFGRPALLNEGRVEGICGI